MGPINCAVVGCTNNSRKLEKWKKLPCEVHQGLLQNVCGCKPPFRLFCFPGSIRYAEKRKRWALLLKRENADKTDWQPKNSDRVCSLHFVDEIPTEANPDPSLHLGYSVPKKSTRRKLVRTFEKQSTSNDCPFLSPPHSPHQVLVPSTPIPDSQAVPVISPPPADHGYCLSAAEKRCLSCVDKRNVVLTLASKVKSLTLENRRLKRQNLLKKNTNTPFSWKKIKTDQRMNFYTGITNILAFNIIFDLIKPFVDNIVDWKGPSKTQRNFSKCNRRKLINGKVTITRKNQFLLCLMKLRLGLLNEDLSERFCISKSLCSNIFKTWIRTLSLTLGSALIQWIPKESILDHMPDMFKEKGYGNVRCIIDCSEVFIERSKSLAVQAATWSDYKHHNTAKFLIGIAPTGFISFISECYGGRATDKFICNDSGFFDLLEYGDHIMADRGFQIQEELLLKYCHLVVPPGARMKSQMTSMECSKTKTVANLRIHVERSIRRVKTYRILQTPMPITMLHHIDDIVKTCAALCNLKPMLIQPGKKKN